jgi:hypothetical protein
MKLEMSICRSNNLLEAIINGGRENHRIGATVLVRLLEFAGATEFNLQCISGRVINMEKSIINNQEISLKVSKITLNLILKVQIDIKEGRNWVKKVVENGVKLGNSGKILEEVLKGYK